MNSGEKISKALVLIKMEKSKSKAMLVIEMRRAYFEGYISKTVSVRQVKLSTYLHFQIVNYFDMCNG